MAGGLKPGDAIRTLGGSDRVASIEEVPTRPAFHVRVGERRGIFVGKAGLLAHDDRVNSPVLVPFDAPLTAAGPAARPN